MIERMKGTLTALLNEIKSPHHAQHLGSEYRLRILFHNSTEGENFKELLFSKLGFHRIRVELNEGLRYYCIVVTWNDREQENLIKNIERYLQEDNMGPTNINRENTKFYAIVTDEDGTQKAYEITHPSIDTDVVWNCCWSEIKHTLRFEQGDMLACKCGLDDWARQKDEREKLRAEKDALAKRLGECEDQLRRACEFLNGYGDEHIDIPTEIKNLDHFGNIGGGWTTLGKIKRRVFGKKVANEVKERAEWHGAWRTPKTAQMIIEDNTILDDAVENAINGFYLDLTSGVTLSGTITGIDTDAIYVQQRKSGSSKAMEMIKDMVDKEQMKLELNSIYGKYLSNDVKATQETFQYMKSWALEWNSNRETTPHMNVNIYDSIKDVKFANPATIVFWNDGTKTVVKAQGDEEYVPEVGLAMCICKKVMGNNRDYYRVFKHWMKKV